jgi:hypothetical protein
MTKLELSRAWFEKHIRDEGDHDIGAGAIGIIEGIHHALIEYDRIMAPRPDMLLITPEIRRSIGSCVATVLNEVTRVAGSSSSAPSSSVSSAT